MSENDTSIIEIVELRPEELQLINSIRNNWRFGEITIIVRDGIPFRLKKVTEFIDLKNDKKML